MSREAPIPEEEIQPARPEEKKPETAEGAFLFDDPYWDEVFDSYHDPTLRTCCRR